MAGWHHLLAGHEFEQSPEARDGQGSLEFCNPWGRKESDTTEQLNGTKAWLTPRPQGGTENPKQWRRSEGSRGPCWPP